MKVILSRKGFDSGAGLMASPILSDGTMASLPIPDSPRRGKRLSEIPLAGHDNQNFLDVARMSPRFVKLYGRRDPAVHHDPMLSGPCGVLGQSGAAQSHLEKQNAGEIGDLFLFFGWFKHGRKDFLAFFGFLRVSARYAIADIPAKTLADLRRRRFPHAMAASAANDVVYIAEPGNFGEFHYSENLRLSIPGKTRSVVSLPPAFHPQHGGGLSYHGAPERWSFGPGGETFLRMVARGQEFVAAESNGIAAWAESLVARNQRKASG